MALSTIPFSGLGADASNQGVNFRNLIINGDMSIAQRGTSSTGITSNGYYTVDRFQTIISSLGTWTNSQSTDVPTGQGFSNSLKMECTTADASPSAGDNLLLYHYVEAQNCQHLKFGTSNAESLTLSFWVKSNKTGTLTQNIRQIDGGKFINNSYTINSANTWEKKTLNFVGNTADVIDNDNGAGFQIEWWLDSGSNFRGGTPSSSWHTQNNLDRNADGTISLADTVGNTWYITGVQLEVGTSASDFEFLPYDVNLQRCERYTRRLGDGLWGKASSTTNMIIQCPFFSPMRATPSISAITSAIKTSDVTAADYTSSTGITSANINAYGARLGCINFSGLTSANMYILYDNSSYIALIDAEL